MLHTVVCCATPQCVDGYITPRFETVKHLFEFFYKKVNFLSEEIFHIRIITPPDGEIYEIMMNIQEDQKTEQKDLGA